MKEVNACDEQFFTRKKTLFANSVTGSMFRVCQDLYLQCPNIEQFSA